MAWDSTKSAPSAHQPEPSIAGDTPRRGVRVRYARVADRASITVWTSTIPGCVESCRVAAPHAARTCVRTPVRWPRDGRTILDLSPEFPSAEIAKKNFGIGLDTLWGE